MGHLTLFGVLLSCVVQVMVADLPEYTGCGATIRGIPEGIINYPNDLGHWYHKNQDCIWNIILGEGERMILNFERFHVNGWSKDILVIKNGEAGTNIGTFDGHPKGQLGGKIPPIIASEANEIFLHFTSDHKWNGRGFKLTWETIINDEPGNQCMANTTDNSVLWQQVVSSETSVKATVNQSNHNIIVAMVLEMHELKMDLQEMKNKQNYTQIQLQEMKNKQANTQLQLQQIKDKQDTTQNLLKEMKNKQDTTQSKLDFMIQQLIGFGCWSDMSAVTHPEGFSETRDCILFTCTNGKWLQDGPDPCCDTEYNSGCWSEISQSYLKQGMTGFHECKEYTCYEGEWVPTGVIDPNCTHDSGCWYEISQSYHEQDTTGFHECKEYTCYEGEWVPTGIIDPNCKNDTESPISTDGDSMVSSEPPFIPTEPAYIPTYPPVIPTDPPVIPTDPPVIPTDPPFIPTDPPVIPTDPPVIPTEPPTDVDSDEESGSDCDYSSTFSASHSMNLPAKAECNIQRTGVSEDEKDTILQRHNELRAKVASGNESPQPAATNMLEMQWNVELAEVAQAWTEQCTFGHDAYNDRKICSEDYYVGQNAYKKWGWTASSDWAGAIQNWYDEVSDMPAVSIVSSFNSPGGPAIGHYTQVVWAETYEVGCGAIYYPETVSSGTTYPETKIYVCNYGPAGNFRTRPIYEIAASGDGAATNCPNGPSATYPGLCATPIPTETNMESFFDF